MRATPSGLPGKENDSMKWLPSILVVIALFVLIKMASLRPEAPAVEAGSTAARPAPAARPAASDSSPAGTSKPAAAPPAAQDQEEMPAKAPPREVKPGTIHGTVVNAEGAAVPGVRVHLEDGGMRSSTTSDASGQFQFPGLSPGSFVLRAEDPDSLYTVSSRDQVTLAQGGSAEATVQVDRGRGSILGEVVDQAGAPLAAAPVVVSSDARALPPVRTDSRGRFRIGGIPDGTWRVSVTGFETWPGAIQEVRIDQGLAQGGGSLTLRAPQLLESLTLHLVGSLLHTHEFTGGETVTLRPLFQLEEPALAEYAAPRVARPDAEGTAEFHDLWPGRYELRAADASGKSLLEDATRPIELVLQAGPELAQTVPLRKATLGAGVEVPGWVYFLVFVIFGLFLFLALVVFPMPLAPKAPPGLRAEEAAAATTDGSAS